MHPFFFVELLNFFLKKKLTFAYAPERIEISYFSKNPRELWLLQNYTNYLKPHREVVIEDFPKCLFILSPK